MNRIVTTLKYGLALAVPASNEVLEQIRGGTLVHRTRFSYLKQMITGIRAQAGDDYRWQVDMTGNFGLDLIELMRATLRDYRVVDPDVFDDRTGKGFTSFTYFFLGEPDEAQIAAQAYKGGDGEFAWIHIRGRDMLSDPRRSIFYRRGLFWEADKAVVVKGGYQGPAKISPVPANLSVPMI